MYWKARIMLQIRYYASRTLWRIFNACNTRRMSKRRMQVMAIIHWKGRLLRAIEQRTKTSIRAACIKLERQILTRLFDWSILENHLRRSCFASLSREKEISRKGMDGFRPTIEFRISSRPMENLTKKLAISIHVYGCLTNTRNKHSS